MPIKKYKTYTLQNFDQLPQIIGLSEEFIEPIRTVGQVLPFRARRANRLE